MYRAAADTVRLAGGGVYNLGVSANNVALYYQSGLRFSTTDSGASVAGGLIIAGANDALLDLNQTGTDTGWSYINFKTLGTRNYYVGQDSSKNFNIYNDNIDVVAISVSYASNITTIGGDLTVAGGDIVLSGTGRIQGVDTVSVSTDAANKAYVDAHDGGTGVYVPLSGGSGTGQAMTGDLYIDGSGSQNFHSLIFHRNGSSTDFARVGFEDPTANNSPFLITSSGNGNEMIIEVGTGDDIEFRSNNNSGTTSTFATIGSSSSFTGDVTVSGTNGITAPKFKLNNNWEIQPAGSSYARFTNWVNMEGIGFYTASDMYMDLDDSSSRFVVRGTGNTEIFVINTAASNAASFTGLVSGITPTSGANFTTKDYVDTAVSGAGNVTTGGFTSGRIPFANSSVNLDNSADLAWNDTDKKLVIGQPTSQGGSGTVVAIDGRMYIEDAGTNWDVTTPGTGQGSLHFDPQPPTTNNIGNAITFGASDSGSGTTAHAGIYTRSDGSFGTKMYLATTDSYATGSKTAITILQNGSVTINRSHLTISTITNSSSDTDKFLVSNGGQVQYRTGDQVRSDIGAGRVDTVSDDGGSTINVSGSATARTVAAVTGVVSSSSANLATGAQIQTAINEATTGALKFVSEWSAAGTAGGSPDLRVSSNAHTRKLLYSKCSR